jgi:hypothetical protein
MSAWSASTGVYSDATNQTGRYAIFNGTVNDTFTAIQWEQAVSASQMDWASAASYCGNRTTGGLTGWRVPNIVELQTLVDYTISFLITVPINALAFPVNTYNNVWSATAKAGDTENAWYTSFKSLGALIYDLMQVSYEIRCVRSCYLKPPASRYFVSAGQVTDTVTGLTWEQSSLTTGGANNDGRYSQSSARSYCAELMLGGSIWRLPTAKELLTLIDYSVNQNSLMMNAVFSGGLVSNYWSSTLQADLSTGAWYGIFSIGQLSYLNVDSLLYVRCIRNQ